MDEMKANGILLLVMLVSAVALGAACRWILRRWGGGDISER